MTATTDDSGRIAGCSFSVYPMSDRFADIILSALDETDTGKVWINTDEVSTIVRGRIPHIFDVAGAVFLQATETGEHVVFSGTFSVGCPGDTEGHTYMADDTEPANAGLFEENDREVAAKFALYPMDSGDYMDVIYRQIDAMKEHGVEVSLTHYETKLAGRARDVFRGLQKVFEATEEAGSEHTVMTVTVAANSPSFENR